MAITTSNTANAFVENQVYSTMVLENLHAGLLPDFFYRNVSDFGAGDTLNIDTIGEVTIQDLTENEDPTYNPIDTGRVNLTISEDVGDAWYITDQKRQDGANIPALLSARAEAGSRALKEYQQSSAFQALYDAQTDADANLINGFAHRVEATGAGGIATNADFSNMALAFDMANAPAEGRVAIVTPVVAATLEKAFQGTYNVDSNPTMQMVLEQGMAEGMQFRFNLFGWNVFVSTLLPDGSSDPQGLGALGYASKGCIFMSVASDMVTPLMYAERQAPSSEAERNKDKRRDEHTLSCRWGFGAQRVDTLGTLTVHATLTA